MTTLAFLSACLRWAIPKAAALAIKPLPYWPTPRAKCPAHGKRFCSRCHRPNPSRCQCDYYAATGLHWDTCPGRIR